MPNINIKNLIIFGDSMSDIGNKRETVMGVVARALGLMRTNEIGRYSDGRNWTDFLWEWAGARSMVQTDRATTYSNTEVHRSLTADSSQDSGFGRPITYCNYAEGGAMGASDRPATGLGTFKEQVQRYIAERGKFALSGDTLHILWFGLNDLVTNERPPDTMGYVVDELGTGMRSINMEFGSEKEHFLVLNLPSPAGAIRLLKLNDIKVAAGFHKGALVFNEQLAGLTNGYYYDKPERVLLVDLFEWLAAISDNPAEYGLELRPQPQGVAVRYQALSAASAHRNCVTTSDDAHPTEAVYKLIARQVAKTLRTKYELGSLSTSRLL